MLENGNLGSSVFFKLDFPLINPVERLLYDTTDVLLTLDPLYLITPVTIEVHQHFSNKHFLNFYSVSDMLLCTDNTVKNK